MSRGDVFLSEDRVSVVGSATERSGWLERGAFEVGVERGETPKVRMSGRGTAEFGTAGEERIRLDGTDVQRDAGGGNPRIGAYAELTSGEPGIGFAAALAGADLSESTGLSIGNDDRDGAMMMRWDGAPGMLLGDGLFLLGNGDNPGTVEVRGGTGATTAEIRGDRANVNVGGEGTAGSIALRDADGEVVGWFEAGDDGDAVLTDGEGTPAIRIKQGGAVEFPNTDGVP